MNFSMRSIVTDVLISTCLHSKSLAADELVTGVKMPLPCWCRRQNAVYAGENKHEHVHAWADVKS